MTEPTLEELRREYRLCKVAYDRGDPFATEAMARNCHALIAALERRVEELERMNVALQQQFDDGQTVILEHWKPRAEQAEAALAAMEPKEDDAKED